MSVYLIPLPDCVIRTRTVAAWPFCRTGFEIGLRLPSRNVIVAEGFVVKPMSTGGLSFCSPAVPAVSVKVCISHSAALPFWFAAGVVAFTSIRAQPEFTASAVAAADVSEKSIVRFVWLIDGALQVPEEKADAATLMLE